MSSRRSVVALAAAIALARLATASAADLPPNAAYTLTARSAWSREAPPKPDELAAARKVLEAQAAKEPEAAKWGNRGEYQGRIVLAGIAAQKEDWAKMSKEYTAAETAEGDGADPVNALRSQAFLLLTKKKDPQAALPIAERYVNAAPADDLT